MQEEHVYSRLRCSAVAELPSLAVCATKNAVGGAQKGELCCQAAAARLRQCDQEVLAGSAALQMQLPVAAALSSAQAAQLATASVTKARRLPHDTQKLTG